MHDFVIEMLKIQIIIIIKCHITVHQMQPLIMKQCTYFTIMHITVRCI